MPATVLRSKGIPLPSGISDRNEREKKNGKGIKKGRGGSKRIERIDRCFPYWIQVFLSYEEIVAEFWNSKLIYNWCIVIGGLRRIIKIISSFRKFRRNLAARDWERLERCQRVH